MQITATANEPFNLPGRLRMLADDFTSAPNAPDPRVHPSAPLEDVNIEAADALEQRLGLLRDAERRLGETLGALRMWKELA